MEMALVFLYWRKTLSKRDLSELETRGLNNERLINFVVEQTAFFLSLETLTNEKEAVEILQGMSEVTSPLMEGQIYPSVEDLVQLVDPFEGFKQFFLKGFEANKSNGIHDFEIVKNKENEFQVNCTYCAFAEIPLLLTGSTKPAIPSCYYDDLIFPKWKDKLGISYSRSNTIARGGRVCDFRFIRL